MRQRHYHQRKRAARDLSQYDALRASPAGLGSAAAGASLSALALPANSDIGVSLDATTSSGDIVVATSTGRSLGIGGGASGQVFRLGWLEEGVELTVQRGGSAPAGTLTLYVLDEWHRAFPIATGTFT